MYWWEKKWKTACREKENERERVKKRTHRKWNDNIFFEFPDVTLQIFSSMVFFLCLAIARIFIRHLMNFSLSFAFAFADWLRQLFLPCSLRIDTIVIYIDTHTHEQYEILVHSICFFKLNCRLLLPAAKLLIFLFRAVSHMNFAPLNECLFYYCCYVNI